MTDGFENADYYDCTGSEVLEHVTILDALEAYLDDFLSPHCNTAAIILDHAPYKVTAHQRKTVDDAWIRSTAEVLLEEASEAFDQEFGDPDGNSEVPGPSEEATLALIQVLKAYYKGYRVWQCEESGSQVFTAHEVEVMMRQENPDWFLP